MIHTPICDMLGIKYPVFQGGMAWIADGRLAAAVSNGGGLGIVAAGVYWKLTGNVGGAILIIVCVTTAAILAAVLIALFYQHYVKKHLK